MRREWLFSLALAVTACGGKNTALSVAQFRDVAPEAGLVFHHFNGATGRYYMPEIVGSGVALFDYDNDGDVDVFLVQGGYIVAPTKGEEPLFPLPAGHPTGARLFRNEVIPSGRMTFTDVTDAAGLRQEGVGMGTAAGDIDNDGDLDLYVTYYGPNRLYRNEGNGRFTDITAVSGTKAGLWSTSAMFTDIDRDGLADLFVTSYVDFTPAIHKNCKGPHGEKDYCGPAVYDGVASRVYRNLGGGKFEDRTQSAGIHAAPGPGLGVAAIDANRDGWPDVYVANDGKPNHLWLNQRNFTFAEKAMELGVALADTSKARAGMGIAAADVMGDGKTKLLVTNLTNEGATLFESDGATGFFDISEKSGLARPTVPYTGFGVGWFDSLNRGRLDAFFANGAVKVEADQRGGAYPYGQRNLLLQGGEEGRFTDVTANSGPGLAYSEVSRAAGLGDLDNDGDIDIVVTNNNGPVRLLRNETGNRNHWLLVKVDAGPANRFGIGTVLELRREGRGILRRTVETAYGYLTANDVRVHFGLGADAGPVQLRATWTDGGVERWTIPAVDRVVLLKRGEGRL